MRFIFILFICLCMHGLLSAEIVGDVEYHLPKLPTKWNVHSEVKNERGSTLTYAPSTCLPGHVDELFGVNYNHVHSASVEKKDIERMLSGLFPDTEVNVTVLEKTPKSFLYEWGVYSEGQERAHGWSRIFVGDKDTTVLGYQTTKIDYLKKAQSIWLPVLKKAKVIY